MNCIDNLKALIGTSLEGKQIYYKGDASLLKRKKVSIVGSRKPTPYARALTYEIASKLAKTGVVVVSGGAIGIDAIAHKAVGASNTIMVSATGLDKRYPAINKKLIEQIENEGLVLSQFKESTPSFKYNFPLRNELIVALGEVLVVPYADKNSGTMRSVEYAKKLQKEIFVLPHRLGESEGTNSLLAKGEAKVIFDIDAFVQRFGAYKERSLDPFLEFCKTNPTYEDAVQKFSDRVFEAELTGEIEIKNGRVFLQNSSYF